MKLRIPILSDLKSTFSRWASEIRGVDFLTSEDFIWKDWDPQFTVGAGTVTAITIYTARYLKVGKICWYKIHAKVTMSAATFLYFTPPVPGIIDPKGAGYGLTEVWNAVVINGGNTGLGYTGFISTNGTQITVQPITFALVVPGTVEFYSRSFYETQ